MAAKYTLALYPIRGYSASANYAMCLCRVRIGNIRNLKCS